MENGGSDRDGKLVFFNGSVMRGQPAHENLRGASFLRVMHTAAKYRMYSIGDQHPAMISTCSVEGRSFPGELYFVPDAVWPGIEETEPWGLYRGLVDLLGGVVVHGMLARPELGSPPARDISSHGGWLEYLAARRATE
jgi:gamma-glutamylcyclotransferase (GGCT)/AIG2-like uncharacterized protein YtfP